MFATKDNRKKFSQIEEGSLFSFYHDELNSDNYPIMIKTGMNTYSLFTYKDSTQIRKGMPRKISGVAHLGNYVYVYKSTN